MATYVIGDIHGCFQTFQHLLEKVGFNPAVDRLYHTGDLVNGGPDSLLTLRWFSSNREVAESVLGNHDLHLLAVVDGKRRMRKKDCFKEVMNAADRGELMEWLRRRPMMVVLGDRVLVHAGLLPEWSVEEALRAAGEVEQALRSEEMGRLLKTMYGNRPRTWRKAQRGKSRAKRWRVTINAMTRMRALRKKGGRLEFGYNGAYEAMPKGLAAWFDMPEPEWEGKQVICGHWSALGLRQTDRVLAVDTGCRWGRKLTAVRLEDEAIIQVDCRE